MGFVDKEVLGLGLDQILGKIPPALKRIEGHLEEHLKQRNTGAEGNIEEIQAFQGIL